MKKWNLIIDVERCENCYNCVLANKDEHVGNAFPGYAAPQPPHGAHWIRIERKVRGATPAVDVAYLPTLCNHCDQAPCLTADGAVRKRQDGIVIIDPVKARGRREIVDSCPYGAISWNETEQLPQIWIFDAHLLDQGWREPRCAQVCPTGVFEAVKVSDADMAARASSDELQVLKPELGTHPRIYYRNLHRYTHCFVAGSVMAKVSGAPECVSGAEVRLSYAGAETARTLTDAFGDFKIDRLPPGGSGYAVDVVHPQFGGVRREFDLRESLYLGCLELT